MTTTRKAALALSALLAAVTLAAATIGGGAAASADATAVPACAGATAPPPAVRPTTVRTLQQAYECVFAHYYDGSALDDRTLLTAAFAGLTRELVRLGLDQPDATAPALTGDRRRDWAAFRAVYQRVTGHLPADPATRQAVAAATMNGMLTSLHDNHAGWSHGGGPGGGPGTTTAYGLGFTTSPALPVFVGVPDEALPPMFISAVQGGPAAAHGLKPGDVIEAVNGAPPFVAGVADRGIGYALSQQYPRHDPVTLALRRPATGRTWTVTLTPELFTPTPESTRLVTSALLDGDVAGIRLAAFLPGAADAVLAAVADLRRGRTLRGVVLDLRGNPGGAPEEVARLLGAFAHGKAWSYDCDHPDHCPYAHRTDDSVPLLGLPLAVLTDRNCGSACDAFSGAVKDLRLGSLVGTRTAGVVAGPAQAYLLDDGSALELPSRHELGARHEMIDGIGVAPDRYLPLTPEDLSAGRDPGLAEAVRLLRG